MLFKGINFTKDELLLFSSLTDYYFDTNYSNFMFHTPWLAGALAQKREAFLVKHGLPKVKLLYPSDDYIDVEKKDAELVYAQVLDLQGKYESLLT